MIFGSIGNTVVQVADFDQLPEAVRHEFIQLRELFRAGILNRWQEIESSVTREAREQALHRLIGAASSYGFTQLGEVARQAEDSLKAGGLTESSKAMQNLKAVIGELVRQ